MRESLPQLTMLRDPARNEIQTTRWLAVLAVVALAVSGCTSPAVLQSAPTQPDAVGPEGFSVSGGLGLGSRARLRGNVALVARPLETLGVYAGGLWALSDSSGRGGPTSHLNHRYAEVGVLGAVPIGADAGLVLTGGIAGGVGAVESGGSFRSTCGLFTCDTRSYVLSADASRASVQVGTQFADGVRNVSFGLRIARSTFRNVQRDGIEVEDTGFWVAEPYTGASYPIGFGSLDLDVVIASVLGDVEQTPDISGTRPLYAVDPITVNVGLTLDLARVWKEVR